MADLIHQIKILDLRYKDLYKELKNVNLQDPEKSNSLNNLIKGFDRVYRDIFKDLMDSTYQPESESHEEDTIHRLESLTSTMKIFVELSKNNLLEYIIKRRMKKEELTALIKECYAEVIEEKAMSIAQQQAAGAALAAKKGKAPESGLKGASKAMEKMSTKELEKIAGTKHKGLPKHVKENEEMDLPADTGKNINMGFDNQVGLDTDTKMSKNMNKVMAQIDMLKNKLAPFIADFKAKKLSKEQYMEATKGLVADLKKAQMALELMMAKI